VNPWVSLVVLLAGVNLTRLLGRGVMLAILTVVILAAAVALGPDPTAAWVTTGGAILAAGVVVVTWQRWCLGEDRRWAIVGLALFATGVGTQFLLLADASTVTVIWPRLAAALLLAEPTNRILRWAMGMMGKAPGPRPDLLGRGEAIGVLERWLALAMVARGDYAALGFVLAAKALARHRRFEDDPEFAEYFLVGTLASILAAIAVTEGLLALQACLQLPG
jgi:hypothetical protein